VVLVTVQEDLVEGGLLVLDWRVQMQETQKDVLEAEK
jgi:hypothetical protein